jgi:glycosyltransferase involved in cell wall biosynthesis
MITVIIPVYNGAKYLAAAIESVLAQRTSPAEILVVDDGSEDHSAQVAARFAPRVRYLHQPHRGPGAARNHGVERATGEYLAFLDADDLWTPDRLTCQMAVLDGDSAVEAVLGRVENFISPELAPDRKQALAPSAEATGALHIGALLIRRRAFERVGIFDVRWQQGEFIEWWARAVEAGLRHVILPQLLLQRRLHDSNLTQRARDQRVDYVRMLHDVLARRRNAGISSADKT